MTTTKPNLGLQIALMIFVLITIALAVSTFMFFKQSQEAELAKKSAEDNAKKAADAQRVAEQDVRAMKPLFGKGDQDKVAGIIDDWNADKVTYAATYHEPLQTYPEMLKHLLDDIMQLNADKTQLQSEVASAKAARDKQKKDDDVQLASAKESLGAMTNDYKTLYDKIDHDRSLFEGNLAVAQAARDKQAHEVTRLETLAKNEKDKNKVIQTKQKEETAAALAALVPYQGKPFEGPTGRVLRVNQREHTVWIDLGQIDGLQPQMIFTVWDKLVTNMAAKTSKSKGTIEVIRILDPHMAEARITDDHIIDPILKDDKIWSPTFRPGLASHYGVDGLIDIHGDGESDLPQLLSLIHANGGVIDAVVDENGKRSGKLTPGTKLLVLGKSPLDAKNAEALKNYNAIQEEAKKLQIPTMSLQDFLASMGYQGRERSVNFDKGITAPEAPAAKPDDTFRKRP